MIGIRVENARENNLKGITVEIPRRQLTVLTGVSGSGKSTLAYNIIYAEGQRRYLETFSTYARQFLHLFSKPNVEWVTGLSPTLALRQNIGGVGMLSTVGTLSEVYDYLRLLFYRYAIPHCPRCDEPLQRMHAGAIASSLAAEFAGRPVEVLAPLVRERKGSYDALLRALARQGIARVRVDGNTRGIERVSISKRQKHTIEAVVGSVVVSLASDPAITRLIELALTLGQGQLTVVEEGGGERVYSLKHACPSCGFSTPDPTPSTFSFTSTRSRCARCAGTGEIRVLIPEAVFGDLSRPLALLEPRLKLEGTFKHQLARAWAGALAAEKTPSPARWDDLSREQQSRLLSGGIDSDEEESVSGIVSRYLETMPEAERLDIEMILMRHETCPSCDGDRLAAEGHLYRLAGQGIGALARLPLDELRAWFHRQGQELRHTAPGADTILEEMVRRLDKISRVGLGYLHLHRGVDTLSGGELQRLRLTSRLLTRMSGVLYVLDEPSIGLHRRDLERLLELLREIRDQGNTVLVVEHDEETIRAADHVIDLGPGGGSRGGHVLYAGPVAGLAAEPRSETGRFLAGQQRILLPAKRRNIGRSGVRLSGLTTHNLKNCSVFFPLGVFSVVTGVSGSGKSSLVTDTLLPVLKTLAAGHPARFPFVTGCRLEGKFQGVCFVDQRPVGRTSRSTPATYIGIFDDIRRFFARLPEAQARGLTARHFSFNLSGGRCEHCGGLGEIRTEMKFLPDAYSVCSACQGRRYADGTLAARYGGKSIADVLDMDARQAAEHFSSFLAIHRRLRFLEDVGMGYIRLGQPTPTLSGGEQQRLKLAAHLSGLGSGRTVFILDEPTTGLHFAEIGPLCALLHELVDRGNTVVAIEHHPDFIKQADYVVDLGPGSGEYGGEVLYAGPLEGLLHSASSLTAQVMQPYLV